MSFDLFRNYVEYLKRNEENGLTSDPNRCTRCVIMKKNILNDKLEFLFDFSAQIINTARKITSNKTFEKRFTTYKVRTDIEFNFMFAKFLLQICPLILL